jgi:hypothetical protein
MDEGNPGNNGRKRNRRTENGWRRIVDWESEDVSDVKKPVHT